MIFARQLEAIQLTLEGRHEEPGEIARLRQAGYTSVALFVQRNRTLIIGAGRGCDNVPGVGGQRMQALAVWCETPAEIEVASRELGGRWQCYPAKRSHLPQIDPPVGPGRWLVCYAEVDATLPAGFDIEPEV